MDVQYYGSVSIIPVVTTGSGVVKLTGAMSFTQGKKSAALRAAEAIRERAGLRGDDA